MGRKVDEVLVSRKTRSHLAHFVRRRRRLSVWKDAGLEMALCEDIPHSLCFNDTLIVAAVRYFESGAFSYIAVHGHLLFFSKVYKRFLSRSTYVYVYTLFNNLNIFFLKVIFLCTSKIPVKQQVSYVMWWEQLMTGLKLPIIEMEMVLYL